jgi:hypothetical protein
MTDIEVKQLIERLRQRSNSNYMLMSHPPKPAADADCHMAADLLQQALAFKQEVSDIVEDYSDHVNGGHEWNKLMSLIIPKTIPKPKPKPDPLVEVIEEWYRTDGGSYEADADALRKILDAHGLEITEK